MATKKVVKAEIDKKQTLPVYIPARSREQGEGQFVGINGRRVMIRKGEIVNVDPAVAEVIYNSQRQEKKNDEFILQHLSAEK